MSKKTLEQIKAEGLVVPASKMQPTERKLPKKRKTSTMRAQDLRSWEHWKRLSPLLDRMYPAPWVTFQDSAAAPPDGLHGDNSELVAGIDPALSNPDAIKTIEVLMKGHQEMLQSKLNPTEAPTLILKAWICYARLFALEYEGPGDQALVPNLRLLFRRLCAKQSRIRTSDIMQRMAGFVFRMDMARRNRKGQYFPKQSWVDIYGADPKYSTAWQDLLLSDASIKDPMSYMLSVKPFIERRNPDGTAIVPTPIPAAQRLAAIRRRLQERTALLKKNEDELWSEGTWDKIPEAERIRRAIGTDDMNEMHRLEKELEGDPADRTVHEEPDSPA